MEMVPNSNFAHRARSSQINMLCVTNKYRLCEFHLNALAGQKGEFCDLVILGHLYKIHHVLDSSKEHMQGTHKNKTKVYSCSCSLGILCLSSDLD